MLHSYFILFFTCKRYLAHQITSKRTQLWVKRLTTGPKDCWGQKKQYRNYQLSLPPPAHFVSNITPPHTCIHVQYFFVSLNKGIEDITKLCVQLYDCVLFTSLLIKTGVLHYWTPRDSPRPSLSPALYHFFSTAQCLFSLMLIWERNFKK